MFINMLINNVLCEGFDDAPKQLIAIFEYQK
jgi:hypothetical protein